MCMSVYLVPIEARKRCCIPRTGVTLVCEPPCGCWESNSGTLHKQMFLTIAPKRTMLFMERKCLPKDFRLRYLDS